MFDDNQKYILYIFSITFLIVLVLIGLFLYRIKKNNDNDPFPKQELKCPDYWEDTSVNKDGSICVNKKGLGKCRNNMDFSNTIFSGNKGRCNKAKWANLCDLTWDGITNRNHNCDNINNKVVSDIANQNINTSQKTLTQMTLT